MSEPLLCPGCGNKAAGCFCPCPNCGKPVDKAIRVGGCACAYEDLCLALVRDIHQMLKRGPTTQDHGLIGNLKCIVDHVAPKPPV